MTRCRNEHIMFTEAMDRFQTQKMEQAMRELKEEFEAALVAGYEEVYNELMERNRPVPVSERRRRKFRSIDDPGKYG